VYVRVSIVDSGMLSNINLVWLPEKKDVVKKYKTPFKVIKSLYNI